MFKKLMLLAITMLFVFGFWGCQKQIDIEAEKEAIKQVIQAQLDAIKNFNYDGEAAVWARKPYIVRKKTVGWDSVSVFYQNIFKKWKSEPENYLFREFTASNFDIYINGNFASVFHGEHYEGIWEGKETSGDNKPHKYLEKIEGEWKIITLF